MMARRIGWFATLLLAVAVCASIAAPATARALESADGRYDCTQLADGSVSIHGYEGTDTSLTIPAVLPLDDGSTRVVEAIAWYAFDGCTTLATVTIPASVTTIGEGAFMDCTSLARIAVPGSVASLGKWAFEDCTSLSTAVVGNGVTAVGASTFSGCASLRSVKLGTRVKTIGPSAFGGCVRLAKLALPNSVTSVGALAFEPATKATIAPKAAVKRLRAGHSKATVRWMKSVSGRVSGFQIAYERSRGRCKTAIARSSRRSRTISKLAKGRRYAFRVRTYRTISGTRYYGVWSVWKSVKVK